MTPESAAILEGLLRSNGIGWGLICTSRPTVPCRVYSSSSLT